MCLLHDVHTTAFCDAIRFCSSVWPADGGEAHEEPEETVKSDQLLLTNRAVPAVNARLAK